METSWERVARTRWRFSPSFGLHCAANRALRVLCLPRARSPQGECHWGCEAFEEGGLANMQKQDRPRFPSCVGGQAPEAARGGQLPASEERGN